MNQEKSSAVNAKRKRRRGKKIALLVLAFLLIASAAVSGTLAYLVADTVDVKNEFTPSNVACKVTETFDGNTKKNVNVTNTGDTEAYIRVKLVTYRVNEAGQHIGGTADIPEFTPGTNWVLHDGYYYYTLPVAPDGNPEKPLIGDTGITLEDKYTDADGGKQVIEVMAEAIQAKGADSSGTPAVKLAWNVSVGADSKLDIH